MMIPRDTSKTMEMAIAYYVPYFIRIHNFIFVESVALSQWSRSAYSQIIRQHKWSNRKCFGHRFAASCRAQKVKCWWSANEQFRVNRCRGRGRNALESIKNIEKLLSQHLSQTITQEKSFYRFREENGKSIFQIFYCSEWSNFNSVDFIETFATKSFSELELNVNLLPLWHTCTHCIRSSSVIEMSMGYSENLSSLLENYTKWIHWILIENIFHFEGAFW